jgi:SAM-dependent methyltransferase
MNNITEEEYWDNFWMHLSLPCRVNENFSNDHNISVFLKRYIPSGENRKIALEIGCAPGKWMIYLSEVLNFHAEGCEYLRSAAEKTQQNLQLCGISDAVIHQGDFITYNFENRSYDLILALGIIEHFNDPIPIIEKMVSLLNADGILIIGIPKFTGLNYFICKVVDRNLEYPLLPAHNLTIMNINFFIDLGKKFKIKRIHSDYIGGFEPDFFDISRSPIWFKLIFHAIRIVLTNRIFQNLNCCFYTGYIMAAYKKDNRVFIKKTDIPLA